MTCRAILQGAWEPQGNGTVTIHIFANDTTGRRSAASVTVRKDIIKPVIALFAPHNKDKFGPSSPPSYDLSVVEPNLDKMWVVVDAKGRSEVVFFNETTGTIPQEVWDLLMPGKYWIAICANDTAGNVALVEVEIIKTGPPAGPMPGWPIVAVSIAAACALPSAITVKRRRKG